MFPLLIFTCILVAGGNEPVLPQSHLTCHQIRRNQLLKRELLRFTSPQAVDRVQLTVLSKDKVCLTPLDREGEAASGVVDGGVTVGVAEGEGAGIEYIYPCFYFSCVEGVGFSIFRITAIHWQLLKLFDASEKFLPFRLQLSPYRKVLTYCYTRERR